ncbi:MAG: ATP-binding cassette domain-containing protein [Alphaproteobacteria bacterium]|nr:ATP-binding cassette domain-containing protein [Alphaproteobacteria bacterium]
MNAVLAADAVTKYFPLKRTLFSRAPQRFVKAVDGVDLRIEENETLALVGESGSGKTTLGNLLLGLTSPTSGSVRWSGRAIEDLPADEHMRFRRDVQVIFQDPYGSLNPRQPVRTILARPVRLHGLAKSPDAEAARLLELVGLRPAAAYLDRFPHEFSGGQRQRIAIARALALRPRVIVADEPVSALDVSVRAQILKLLTDVREQLGISILFTTHDLGVVRYIADRVAVMYLGKIVELAPRESLFRATHHPYSRMLLGSALSPNPDQRLANRNIRVEGEPPSPVDPPPGCRFRARCPLAYARCTVEQPQLREVRPGHLSACHLDNTQEKPHGSDKT